MVVHEVLAYTCSGCGHSGHIPKGTRCIPTCKQCGKVLKVQESGRLS